MSKLNATDIQGFVLRGYNLPVARYLFLHFEDAKRARSLIARLLSHITTGQRWDGGKAAEHGEHRIYSPRPGASGIAGRYAAELSR